MSETTEGPYEAPHIEELGTVRGLTEGGDTTGFGFDWWWKGPGDPNQGSF